MNTPNAVLTYFYTSPELEEVLLKVAPGIRDDVKQHVFAEIMEREERENGFIVALQERGKMKSFLVKTIYNTVHFSEHKFHRQNRTQTEIPTAHFDNDGFEDEDLSPNLKKINEHIKRESVVSEMDYEELVTTCAVRTESIYWYNRDLLKLYAEHRSYRKVSKLTGIPHTSIREAVLSAREEIKKMLWE